MIEFVLRQKSRLFFFFFACSVLHVTSVVNCYELLNASHVPCKLKKPLCGWVSGKVLEGKDAAMLFSEGAATKKGWHKARVKWGHQHIICLPPIPVILAVCREQRAMCPTAHFTYFGCFLLQGSRDNWEQRIASISFSGAEFQACSVVFYSL